MHSNTVMTKGKQEEYFAVFCGFLMNCESFPDVPTLNDFLEQIPFK